MGKKFTNNTIISHNWIHGGPKSGIRFDGNFDYAGVNATDEYNVVFLNKGIIGKGDYQTYKNNLVFNYDDSN